MKHGHLRFLVCPDCKESLQLWAIAQEGDEIETGRLMCPKCKKGFEILRHIPRFVPNENYASGCMIINLILLPTIIAGLTGYIKRRHD